MQWCSFLARAANMQHQPLTGCWLLVHNTLPWLWSICLHDEDANCTRKQAWWLSTAHLVNDFENLQ